MPCAGAEIDLESLADIESSEGKPFRKASHSASRSPFQTAVLSPRQQPSRASAT